MQFNFLFSFFIRPIELILEFIFSSVYKMTDNVGVSVIFVGILMNILILPLYMRADVVQKKEKELEASLKKGIDHIKKTFKGDERLLMLNTYYNQNNYSPIYVLKGSISLLLQIPFFMAGFHLLSNLKITDGVSFLMIKDLGLPDNMFSIGSLTINVLPILMTLINFMSSAIYTRGEPISKKLQPYLLALLFLVLLYNSPSCLVLYWTTNNLFSLIKNIVLEIIVPKFSFRKKTLPKIAFLNYKRTKSDTAITFIALFFVAFLTGALVSSDVIRSNIQAFIDPYNPIDPILYVINSLCIALGLYVFWGGVIYFMLTEYGRNIMCFVCGVLSIVCMINYFGFSPEGSLTPQLILYDAPEDSMKVAFNGLVIILIVILFFILFKNKRALSSGFILLETITIALLGIMNFIKIENRYADSSYISEMTPISQLQFSRNGNNVVVIMLDKGMGDIIQYVLNEDPSLIEQFDGFTFYENTLSFGAYTMSGSPSLYGGYEYTPERINSRDDVLLRDKQNESLLVMPVNFVQNGYNVTVCDPSWAGYEWIPDTRIYNEYPDIEIHPMRGAFNEYIDGIRNFSLYERNFFCYGFYRLTPMFIRGVFYDNSMFNAADREHFYDYVQTVTSPNTSIGYGLEFLDSYTSLEALPEITVYDDSNDNNFLMFANNSVHDASMLDEPSYLPSLVVDNTVYDNEHDSRFISGDNSYIVNNSLQYSYYQSMVCSLRSLGEWFDALRENGCYDNTRIIIVADHGCDYFGDNNEAGANPRHFNPLLMVKDFGATGFTISDELMTNAETCFLAFDCLIDSPVNPSTGNVLTSELSSGSFMVLYNDDVIPDNVYDLYTFSPGEWYEVNGDVLSEDSWTHLGSW